MPKYRTTRDNVLIDSMLYDKGAEREIAGWPPRGPILSGALVPADDAARRITQYFAKKWMDPWLPKAPHRDGGKFFLPATAAAKSWRHEFPAAVAPEDERPGMPRYRVANENRFGRQHYAAGAEFAFLGWPEAAFGLSPLNEPACALADYFETNREHPDLPASPWNLFDDSLYLPSLEPLRPGPWAPRLPGGEPHGFKPPNSVAHGDASIERRVAKSWKGDAPARTFARPRSEPGEQVA
jgi:hypothetical protein